MADQEKTREQLVTELTELRQRVAELEIAESKRKQTEEALCESEARLKDLYENAPSAYLSVGADGIIRRCNKRVQELFGYSIEELVGLPVFDLYADTPQGKEKALGVFQRFRSGGMVIGEELQMERADGTPIWISLTVNAIRDAQGRIVESRSMVADITERKRAEEALRNEKEFTETALNFQQDTFFLFEPATGKAIRWNRAFNDITGYTDEEIAGMVAPDSYYSPEELKRASIFIEDVLEIGSGTTELDLICKDGRKVATEYKVSAIKGVDGEPKYFISIGRDITERKRAEEALRELNATLEAQVAARTAEIRAEKEKSEAILRSVGEAIAMVDLHGRIQYVNDAFTTLTGYVAEEAIGQHMRFLAAEKPSPRTLVSRQTALEEGRVWQEEMSIRRKGGRTYDAEFTLAPMHDPEGKLASYVYSHRDTSQQRELERARRRFMTNVSHELRTPVTNIKLYAQMLQRGPSVEKAEQYAQVLDGQVDRLGHLIEDILAMAALDSFQAVMSSELIPVSAIVQDAITRFQDRARAADLSLTSKPLPPDLPTVQGDGNRLGQALDRLLGNAITFTPAGGRVIIETGTAKVDEQTWSPLRCRIPAPASRPRNGSSFLTAFSGEVWPSRGRSLAPGWA